MNATLFPPTMTLQEAAELCARENLTAQIEWVREGGRVHCVVYALRRPPIAIDVPALLRRQAD